MTDGDSVTMNTVCNSDNGTFVTLDDYLPNTFRPLLLPLWLSFSSSLVFLCTVSVEVDLGYALGRFWTGFLRPKQARINPPS